jgi:hypothetical protein
MPIVGIIGGGCSPASDILINLAEVMDVPLVRWIDIIIKFVFVVNICTQVALVNFLFFNDNLVHLDFCMVSSGHTRHLLLFCLPVVSRILTSLVHAQVQILLYTLSNFRFPIVLV